jgi:hypothetical protein
VAGALPSDSLKIGLSPRDPFDAAGRELQGVYGNVIDGRCLFDSVVAGVYDVTISHPLLWSHTPAEPFELTVESVAREEVLHGSVDVPLIQRVLRVLTADGAPHAHSPVWIGTSGSNSTGVGLMTSAEGHVTLELPAQRYTARSGTRDFYRGSAPRPIEFDWRAGEGPLEVRLPAR